MNAVLALTEFNMNEFCFADHPAEDRPQPLRQRVPGHGGREEREKVSVFPYCLLKLSIITTVKRLSISRTCECGFEVHVLILKSVVFHSIVLHTSGVLYILSYCIEWYSIAIQYCTVQCSTAYYNTMQYMHVNIITTSNQHN